MSAALATPPHVPTRTRNDREPGWVERAAFADSNDMLAVTGATYRQLDYWTRQGYLVAAHRHPGSGYRQMWDGVEQRVCEAMVRLAHVGVDVQTAALLARDAVLDGDNEYIHDGVTIKVMVVA